MQAARRLLGRHVAGLDTEAHVGGSELPACHDNGDGNLSPYSDQAGAPSDPTWDGAAPAPSQTSFLKPLWTCLNGALTVRSAAPTTATAQIPAGQSLLAAIELPAPMFGIDMPAGWDAANLSFQVSADGATYRELFDETGASTTGQAAASRAIRFSNPGQWLGVRFLRIRSGTAAAPVAQTAARDLILRLVP